MKLMTFRSATSIRLCYRSNLNNCLCVIDYRINIIENRAGQCDVIYRGFMKIIRHWCPLQVSVCRVPLPVVTCNSSNDHTHPLGRRGWTDISGVCGITTDRHVRKLWANLHLLFPDHEAWDIYDSCMSTSHKMCTKFSCALICRDYVISF